MRYSQVACDRPRGKGSWSCCDNLHLKRHSPNLHSREKVGETKRDMSLSGVKMTSIRIWDFVHIAQPYLQRVCKSCSLRRLAHTRHLSHRQTDRHTHASFKSLSHNISAEGGGQVRGRWNQRTTKSIGRDREWSCFSVQPEPDGTGLIRRTAVVQVLLVCRRWRGQREESCKWILTHRVMHRDPWCTVQSVS